MCAVNHAARITQCTQSNGPEAAKGLESIDPMQTEPPREHVQDVNGHVNQLMEASTLLVTAHTPWHMQIQTECTHFDLFLPH